MAGRVAERLPAPAQRGIRAGWRRLRPYAKRVFYSRPASPLVSVVIPVYNVQRYLPACLDSVLSQSYQHLQVILVDDGSPDRSIDIMRNYAAEDRRIQIVQQPNAGLGAARNTGARHARGSFLMFIDSDDVLKPDAIRTYVRTLRRTGSDFAVGCYERMNSTQTWPAAWWIRSTHRFSRLGTTLVESPDACVNAVAWSKFYRRSFWEKNGFAFPVGVLYEDQALSTRAYATAAKFDILATVTYGWRVREDRSSITQQSTALNDLRARLHALENSLAELDRPDLQHVRNVRLGQYLSNDLPLSIKTAQFADDEFWELLTDALRRLTDHADDEVWDRVSAQHRVAIKLVTEGHRDAVIDFVGLGHNNPKNIPPIVADGNVYLDTPARQVLGLQATDPLLALADHQLGLVSSIRRVYWDHDQRLHVEGWAYIDNVDLAQCETDVRIVAAVRDTDREVDLAVQMRPSVEVTQASKHRYADYRPSCFHAVLDLSAEGLGPGTQLQLIARVSSGGISREALLRGPEPGGSAGRLQSGNLADGTAVEVSYTGKTGLLVNLVEPTCTVRDVRLDGRQLTAEVVGSTNFDPHQLELSAEDGAAVVRTAVQRTATGPRIALTLPDHGDAMTVEGFQGRNWVVTALADDGTRAPLYWPDFDSAVPNESYVRTRAVRTPRGMLTVIDEPASVRVDAVEVVEGTLRVHGRLAGGAVTDLQLAVQTPRARAGAELVDSGDGAFSADIALVADPWHLGSLPLPTADYDLVATIGGVAVPVRLTDELISTLPIDFRSEQLLGKLRLRKPNALSVRLLPPLADDELGARNQQRLQDRLGERVGDPSYEAGAVLLRSYYGEICGCNPRALHEYLHDHPVVPGSPHRIYWTVKDYSVRVPEGGVAVLHDSAEWYRLLHEAQFYMDNMHQPIYHHKPAHQVQIQTFHGYPFKQMGQSHWAMQGRDIAHIRSYLERAADWDYLVSPASYGTAALCREFGYPRPALEIGYPRNDVLFSTTADAIAEAVRRRLDIRSDQTAVLYAPTFRDSMSENDNTAAMVDFLDLDRLAGELGDDYVIMVRGHAFNARLSDRVGSHGTVIDVTDYPDIAELCLASDAAVLDYSSLRFDYALTGKPILFMVPDLEEYQNEARGSLWSYQPTAPGPLLSSTDEVIKTLRDLDRVKQDYAEDYRRFRSDYLDLDDGHATERLVRAVFEADSSRLAGPAKGPEPVEGPDAP
ncbi:CDP-glycerol glycerophosphotransferase [Microlunatus soli]|uniref:CDP-glycerol glycerophosphotransferase n=2 Tax=Microlunatus soli TaxID=630515 RepID=A0A1H2A9X9_9ACTN|nr:CDP-glycerol glycerophosphotransferase [Microlunatus soli]